MAVKVRCRECGTELTAPDAARGKAVKCRECGKPVRVPGGDGPPQRKKAAKPKASIEDDDFFSKLNLDQVEDHKTRICPKCAGEVEEEDIECPHCGINLETGVLSEKQKHKRKLRSRGPDPDLFYKVAWKDSWNYLKNNFGLAVRLALSWTFANSLYCGALFMSTWVDQEKKPLVLFWGGMAIICGIAGNGGYFQLFTRVVKHTVDEEPTVGRFNFDFFTAFTLGVKFMVWPYVLMGPVVIAASLVFAVLLVAGVISSIQDAAVAIGIGALGMFLLGVIPFPVALSHMSAKYTYKAYLPNEMFRITAKHAGPVAFWWLIAICVMLVSIAIAVTAAFFAPDVVQLLGQAVVKIVELCGINTTAEGRGFLFYVVFPITAMVIIALGLFTFSMIMAPSALFIMRATGLFAYYNQQTLETGDRRMAGKPVGFWVRYLGYLIDYAVLCAFTLVAWVLLWLAAWLANELGIEGLGPPIQMVFNASTVLIPFLYFTFSESGPAAATLGMNAMGMQVVTLDGKKPISRGQAAMRLIGRVVGAIPLGAGFFMCAWDKEQQTLHDKMTKTRVVWRPENL